MNKDSEIIDKYNQYRIEVLRLLFSGVDDIIDYDYNALSCMKEALSKGEDIGVSRERKRRTSSFKNVNKSDIN